MRKNFVKVISVGLASVLVFGLAGCASDASTSNNGGDQQNEGTENAGAGNSGEVIKVTAAHTNYYVPYDFEDENGNSDGYEVAVLKAIDELLPQYEFEFVPTTDDDLLIGVESGKYDVGTKGVWWTAARSETYVFPEHYIGASIIGITTRAEDAEKYSSLEAFAKEGGKLVPIAPQNAQYNIIENFNKNHPDTPIELLASETFAIADAYQWLREGRYDAYFDIQTSYESNVAESGEYHDYADELAYAPYVAIPTWPLFNRNNQALADAYDEAWEQLEADGTLERLAQEYFGYSLFEHIPEGYQIGDEF